MQARSEKEKRKKERQIRAYGRRLPIHLYPLLLLTSYFLLLPCSSAQQPFYTPAQPVPIAPAPPAPYWQPPSPPNEMGQLPPNNNPIVPASPIFTDDPFRPVPRSTPYACDQCPLYGLFEIGIVKPHIHGTLSGPVTVMGFPDTVALQSLSLSGTGSPGLEVGYRLGEGLGAVAISYRSLVSEGAGNILGWDFLGEGFQQTILNANIVNIDYASPAYALDPSWDFAWRAGVRVAGVYYSNTVTGGFVGQQATSNFVGAGPHATLEFGRSLDLIPGLAFIGKLDGAILIGDLAQSFEETLTFPGMVFGGASRFHSTRSVPAMILDLGVSYTPPGFAKWARFGVGYKFEYWWDVGTRGNSTGALEVNGIYFRGEFNF